MTALPPEAPPETAPLPFTPAPKIEEAGRTMAFKLPDGMSLRALPFAPSAGAAPPAAPSPEQSTFGESTGPAAQSPLRPALPFQPAAPAPPAARPPTASPPATPPSRPSQIPELTIAQYALLWAELNADPAHTAQIAGRYGIYDARTLNAVHMLWRDRMARDPALYARFQSLAAKRGGDRR